MTNDIHLQDGQIQIGLTAMKQVFILHAGAVVAVLAFIGQAIGGTGSKKPVWDMAYECLPFFAVGIVVSFLMFLSAYAFQYHTVETWRSDGPGHVKHESHRVTFLGLTLLLLVADVALFGIGAYKAYLKIPALLQ